MKRILFVCCVMLVSISSCSLPQLNLFKKIVQHPQPNLQIDNSFFADLGCFDDPACLPENLQKNDPPITSIYEASTLLGGLNPTYPLALASTMRFSNEEEVPAVYVHRCMIQQYIRYVVLVDGNIRLIDSTDQMAALYAPIESADEALSYAIAVTGLSALYDLEESPKPKLYTSLLEETFVTEQGGAYLVHLFDTYLCGCGPHIVQTVDVTVQVDGTFNLSDPVDAFSDPEMDGLCID